MNSSLIEKILPIRLVAFDVDGTLTDGSLTLSSTGEAKTFHVHDGAGLKLLAAGEIEIAIITSRTSEAVTRRCEELGIRHVIQHAPRKDEALERLQRRLAVTPEQTASMGDDLPDLGLFARSGLKLTVTESAPELRAQADWVATRPAGHGAAREAAELILKAQGKWDALVAAFASPQS